jgi:hypothetical protein
MASLLELLADAENPWALILTIDAISLTVFPFCLSLTIMWQWIDGRISQNKWQANGRRTLYIVSWKILESIAQLMH